MDPDIAAPCHTLSPSPAEGRELAARAPRIQGWDLEHEQAVSCLPFFLGMEEHAHAENFLLNFYTFVARGKISYFLSTFFFPLRNFQP